MPATPLPVSAIIPCYNSAGSIARAVESVATQTRLPAELICVDDSSTDDSLAILQRLRTGYPEGWMKIIVLGQNSGPSVARNTAWDIATGDYVAFLDADDIWHPEKLAIQHGIMQRDKGLFLSGHPCPVLRNDSQPGMLDKEIKVSPVGRLAQVISNRFLTAAQNLLLRSKLSEFHTGYRAFSRSVLESLPLMENSDDFVFDNQMLAQGIYFGYRVGEISCPTRYMPEASEINFQRSVKYGFGVLGVSIAYRLQKWGIARYRIYSESGRRLEPVESKK